MVIKAIIFDIDGVLADSGLAVIENTKQLMLEFGLPVQPGQVERMSTAHSAESVLVALAPKLAKDGVLLKKMLRRLSEITRDNLHLVKSTPLAAHIPEFAKKYRLAVASNRKTSARMVLDKLELGGYFSAVLTSADAPPKPDPKMIVLALERLCVAPGEAIFVGDNQEDVAAGNAAGVETLLFDARDGAVVKKFVERFLK